MTSKRNADIIDNVSLNVNLNVNTTFVRLWLRYIRSYGLTSRRNAIYPTTAFSRQGHTLLCTVNPRYNDRICSQRCCHYNEFAIVKNLKWIE